MLNLKGGVTVAKVGIVLIALIVAGLPVAAQSNQSTIQVTDGMEFRVVVPKTLDSAKLKSGDTFLLKPVFRVEINKKHLEGSKFYAKVLEATSIPRGQKGKAEFSFVVNRLVWKGGELALNAYLVPCSPVKSGIQVKPRLESASWQRPSPNPERTPVSPEAPYARQDQSKLERGASQPERGGLGAPQNDRVVQFEVECLVPARLGTRLHQNQNVRLEEGLVFWIRHIAN
jgi:hypothetical protein